MTFALIAALGAAFVAMIACALSVFAWSRSSKQASALRSMTSLQGELIEIRDLLSKVDRWAKRINARDVMNDRRATEQLDLGPAASKDELRKRAGIVAGRPAPHRE